MAPCAFAIAATAAAPWIGRAATTPQHRWRTLRRPRLCSPCACSSAVHGEETPDDSNNGDCSTTPSFNPRTSRHIDTPSSTIPATASAAAEPAPAPMPRQLPLLPPPPAEKHPENRFRGPVTAVRALLLPTGWPESVAPGYARYALACVARNAWRRASYVLGTTALLYALGTGALGAAATYDGSGSGAHQGPSSTTVGTTIADSTASTITSSTARAASSPADRNPTTATATVAAVAATSSFATAALNWTLKDGLGYAAKASVSTSVARVLDRDPKLFRITGDALMVASVAIELLSPLRPTLFLLIGSLASALRQCADAMSGPSYRVFLNSFAITANIGDVSSRGETQVVVGNLLGLAAGAGVSSLLANSQLLASFGLEQAPCVIFFFLVFSTAHMTAVFSETSIMQLRTLNRKRLEIILDDYMASGVVPPVMDVNHREPLSPFATFARKRIELGADLSWLRVLSGNRSTAFQRHHTLAVGSDGRVHVCLHRNATTQDLLRALLHATCFVERLDKQWEVSPQTAQDSECHVRDLVLCCGTWAESAWPSFASGLEVQGWETEKLLVEVGSARYDNDFPVG